MLLSQERVYSDKFEKIDVEWQISDRTAYWYVTSENKPPAQFPNQFCIQINPENGELGDRDLAASICRVR
ncbi:hypothetical protein ACE1CI_36270 [Aerosakkonemataceae cyanobacterium BLCC-F50]|uniref:Uncharacterized protein n=1 Tax=Floridaenema flaviceps BLCC-F50 TaxID=3153642 RepID=A0ABV4Y347_9CYAN